MFGWERKMEDRLRDRRENELHWLRKYFFYVLLNNNVTYGYYWPLHAVLINLPVS